MIDNAIIEGITVSRAQKNLVFKTIVGLLSPQGVQQRNSITLEEIWEALKNELPHRNYLVKAINDMEDKFVVDWNEKPYTIYSV